jgi:hypothetical protein
MPPLARPAPAARTSHSPAHRGHANGHGLAYGFAYDDVGGFSPSLHTNAPTTVTYTIGW